MARFESHQELHCTPPTACSKPKTVMKVSVNWYRGTYLGLFFCNAIFATVFKAVGEGKPTDREHTVSDCIADSCRGQRRWTSLARLPTAISARTRHAEGTKWCSAQASASPRSSFSRRFRVGSVRRYRRQGAFRTSCRSSCWSTSRLSLGHSSCRAVRFEVVLGRSKALTRSMMLPREQHSSTATCSFRASCRDSSSCSRL